MLPLSTELDSVESIIIEDEELEGKIQDYYERKMPEEEIFHRDKNMIITESGYYFALYDNFVTIK